MPNVYLCEQVRKAQLSIESLQDALTELLRIKHGCFEGFPPGVVNYVSGLLSGANRLIGDMEKISVE